MIKKPWKYIPEGTCIDGIIIDEKGGIVGHIYDQELFEQRYGLGDVISKNGKRVMIIDGITLNKGFEKLLEGSMTHDERIPRRNDFTLTTMKYMANRGKLTINTNFQLIWVENYD
ncbi:MAG: hypothetical protein M0P71_00800 [Melioribacteraceae bacterium]|nr:hypothetical protein [Melioribacteraceae bacterium]